MLKLGSLICSIILFTGCCDSTHKETNRSEESDKIENQIFSKGDKIDNDYFSGTAWLNMLVTDKENFDLSIGNVVFEPTARNNWHSHPGGQILLCTDGEGYYQEKGKPIRLLHKGDVVQILPNVEHWHGATPQSSFTHIAITTQAHKEGVVWLSPVTDQEYNSYAE